MEPFKRMRMNLQWKQMVKKWNERIKPRIWLSVRCWILFSLDSTQEYRKSIKNHKYQRSINSSYKYQRSIKEKSDCHLSWKKTWVKIIHALNDFEIQQKMLHTLDLERISNTFNVSNRMYQGKKIVWHHCVQWNQMNSDSFNLNSKNTHKKRKKFKNEKHSLS